MEKVFFSIGAKEQPTVASGMRDTSDNNTEREIERVIKIKKMKKNSEEKQT